MARARTEPLTSHNLCAEVLLNEEKISDEIPWPLKDLFRLCPQARELIWYDTTTAREIPARTDFGGTGDPRGTPGKPSKGSIRAPDAARPTVRGAGDG